MAKQVILAVAGAGKTYTICNTLDKNCKNLILAYTNENIYNINKELVHKFGNVPELTNVMTYDSFLYRYMLCPFEPSILKMFGKSDFIRKGITTITPPKNTIIKNDKRCPNKAYRNKNEFEHYEINGFYYCENISELIMYVKSGKEKLIKRIAETIDKFYSHIFIDEFQDFRAYDFELIIELTKKLTNVTLVGDYYQHSVSGQNNSGKPFKKGKNEVKYNDFITLLEKNKFEVDTKTLIASKRCPKAICDLVSEKLNIPIKANNENIGNINWVDKENIDEILQNDKIVKLVFSNAKKYSFKALNWSYSKGDTFDEVCVILTSTFKDLNNKNFDYESISQITINKLYVALTRTKGNLHLVNKEIFDNVKNKYVRNNDL